MATKIKTTTKKSSGILKKIEEAALVGRGGASYPTARKWAAVKEALKTRKIAYIIANGAEGEPGVKKDAYILDKYPAEFLRGLYLANDFLGDEKIKKIYIYLNHEYYEKYGAKLKTILKDKKYQKLAKKTEFFLKPLNLSYIGGEETAILNLIEGRRLTPRLKPPYPTEHGLFGHPTLINNIETLYNVALVDGGKYRAERLYTIAGAVKKPGVYNFSTNSTIAEVLRATGNYPNFKFFVQIGGGASGEIFSAEQLDIPAESAASIMVYDLENTDEKKLLKYWLNFYRQQSCGNCTPCREGTYRLLELISAKEFQRDLFWEVVNVLQESSFCALGASVPIPLISYFKNIKHKSYLKEI
jgi:NADH:ubiquinone oxidoreductase subunit F (NADH-binding)